MEGEKYEDRLIIFFRDGKPHSNEEMRKYFKVTTDSEMYHQLRAAQQKLKRENKIKRVSYGVWVLNV